MVLVGADVVGRNCLTNKTGTRMIALAARERGIPVYAVCDTSKLVGSPLDQYERHSAAELWPDAPRGVEVLNCYFEPTPLEYFAGVITEEGALLPDEVKSRVTKIQVDQEILDLIASGLMLKDQPYSPPDC
jgi:translation initiation factor 2B subunit (eIF-2B alpha/beta/delta family)